MPSLVGSEMCIRDRRPHAEEQAVPAAGAEIEGATVYVTLEPCGARSSGRQSCAHFLTEARVERVVIACLDPVSYTHLTLPTICSV